MPDMHPADVTDHVTCEHCGVIEYHCDDCGARCWSDDAQEELCAMCFGRNRLKDRVEVLTAALKMAYRLFGKDEADPVKRNMVRGHIAAVLAEDR